MLVILNEIVIKNGKYYMINVFAVTCAWNYKFPNPTLIDKNLHGSCLTIIIKSQPLDTRIFRVPSDGRIS